MSTAFNLGIFGAVVREVGKNLAMAVPWLRRWRTARGRTAQVPDTAGIDRYYLLLDQVLAHTGPVAGKSVLEIGPGDNLMTGLAFLAAGARSYTAIDRFPGPYGDARARRWYALLMADWPRRYPGLAWPARLDPARFPETEMVRAIPVSVEKFEATDCYNIVCSFAVGQHVRNVAAFARAMRGALARDGVGIHVVDFSGHQWDRPSDPMLFRRFPKWLWNAMGSNRGFPNRVPYAAFRAMLEASGLEVNAPETRAWPTGEVHEAVFVCRVRA